jgi:hypothetical protein
MDGCVRSFITCPTLAEDRPAIKPYDEHRWAGLPDYGYAG